MWTSDWEREGNKEKKRSRGGRLWKKSRDIKADLKRERKIEK